MLSKDMQKSYSVAGNVKPVGKNHTASKSSSQEINKKPIVEKPILASTYNHYFRPKVLVRGSGSANVVETSLNEDIPVKNSFNVLISDDDDVEDIGGINVNEEFESKVWPGLKEEVDILLEADIYPSRQVRLNWTIHQMDYFYKNWHKFHLDPSCEEDEEDVDSDVEGIAMDMKPKVDVNATDSMDINAAVNEDVSNVVSLVDGIGFLTILHVIVVRELLLDGIPIIRSLWKSLSIHKNVVKDRPWTILGDFNACLDPSERSTRGSKFTTAMHDFRDCVEEIEVEDISMTGLNFT
ncbi:RNA-directed DNA polymerase, eukaryota, reverse transcriptase zinc-binding domain protein [Tanacetum coccineum]